MSSPATKYGVELILDLHNCDVTKFNRKSISNYFTRLCQLIEMKKCRVYFWDDVGVPIEDRQTLPHTTGTSAVCFILTSTIVVHTLDLLGAVYVNIFSCKKFDPVSAEKFTSEWFGGAVVKAHFVERV
jgi:S-adenosylmethionine/arginine decarboxylase-like enzyme